MSRTVAVKGSYKKGVWTMTASLNGRKATAKGPNFKSAYNAVMNALKMMQKMSEVDT